MTNGLRERIVLQTYANRLAVREHLDRSAGLRDMRRLAAEASADEAAALGMVGGAIAWTALLVVLSLLAVVYAEHLTGLSLADMLRGAW